MKKTIMFLALFAVSSHLFAKDVSVKVENKTGEVIEAQAVVYEKSYPIKKSDWIKIDAGTQDKPGEAKIDIKIPKKGFFASVRSVKGFFASVRSVSESESESELLQPRVQLGNVPEKGTTIRWRDQKIRDWGQYYETEGFDSPKSVSLSKNGKYQMTVKGLVKSKKLAVKTANKQDEIHVSRLSARGKKIGEIEIIDFGKNVLYKKHQLGADAIKLFFDDIKQDKLESVIVKARDLVGVNVYSRLDTPLGEDFLKTPLYVALNNFSLDVADWLIKEHKETILKHIEAYDKYYEKAIKKLVEAALGNEGFQRKLFDKRKNNFKKFLDIVFFVNKSGIKVDKNSLLELVDLLLDYKHYATTPAGSDLNFMEMLYAYLFKMGIIPRTSKYIITGKAAEFKRNGKLPFKQETCVICGKSLEGDPSLLMLECRHLFHEDCVVNERTKVARPGLRGNCKKCRKPFDFFLPVQKKNREKITKFIGDIGNDENS
ncbi:RING finger protein [Candidatus Dependentiae bacterium]